MVKISKIMKVEPKAFKDMDKTWLIDAEGVEGYTFARVAEGQDYNGYWVKDKGQQNQLKSAGTGNVSPAYTPKEKSFKADPIKQESIEKQSTLKDAVDLVISASDGQKLQDKIKAVKATYDELYGHVFAVKEDTVIPPTATPQDLDNILKDGGFFERLFK